MYKPYNCPCCSKAFARKDALKTHLHSAGHAVCLQGLQDILDDPESGYSEEQLEIYRYVLRNDEGVESKGVPNTKITKSSKSKTPRLV